MLILEVKKNEIVHIKTPGGEEVLFGIGEKNKTAKVDIKFLNTKEFVVTREKVKIDNGICCCCDHCGEKIPGWPRTEYPDWIFFCNDTCRDEWKAERSNNG